MLCGRCRNGSHETVGDLGFGLFSALDERPAFAAAIVARSSTSNTRLPASDRLDLGHPAKALKAACDIDMGFLARAARKAAKGMRQSRARHHVDFAPV